VNREELQSVLRQPYQRDRWLETLRTVLPGTDVFASPQSVSKATSNTGPILQLGRVRLQGGRQLAVLEATVSQGIDLTRNRVGLRNQVARLIDLAEYHGILALFHSQDSPDYRFTFAARESVFDVEGAFTKRETAPRRYTYVFGPNEACRTAAERFSQLAAKAHGTQLADVIDAFSVEKLNKEFFSDFYRAFERVRDEISQENDWSDAAIKAEAQTLLNRLLFLYFVQRKGWLNRQRDYLIRNFREAHEGKPKASTYHARFLKPLFQRLSTEQVSVLLPDDDLPFLNGGLFNDEYDEELFRHHSEVFLRNETFGYIFEKLLEPYNFTIHEDSPNNYEVAIDPEMLGRIFEALVLQSEESEAQGKSVRHDTGSHYTPRPIVHYVCRDTLAAWLEAQPPFVGTKDCRARIERLFELDATEGIDEEIRQQLNSCLTSDEAASLRDRLFELRACDPAVGSGAFPMGLLHELINLIRLCETRARGKDPAERDSAWLYETKKHIIEYVLYGVDIQERAIEICKLRLWLSLMVDHELDVDPFNCDARSFHNVLKALDPLPNLDFKIRRANSLVDFIHGQAINLSVHGPSEQMRPILNKLIAAKREFYGARTAKEKRRLRFVIYETTAELARIELRWAQTHIGLIATGSDSSHAEGIDRAQKEFDSVFRQIEAVREATIARQDKALEQIQSWFEDPIRATFVWQLDFAEVFHKHENGNVPASDRQKKGGETTSQLVRYGFDLLIGNPPYLRIQTLTRADPKAVAYYKENYTAAKKGNYDIYVVFVERGLNLLEGHNGQLGYILPHRFFNALYGEPLRALISKGKHLRHVVHFGGNQIFPGATNYVCLLFLSTTVAEDCRFVRADNLKAWLATQQGIEGRIPAEQITAAPWNFAVGEGSHLLDRLLRAPLKLKDVADLFVGLQTDADEVFIVEFVRESNGELVCFSKHTESEHHFEADHLKPFLKGSLNIRRYKLEDLTKRLIFPYETIDGKSVLIPQKQYTTRYPLTWAYLTECKKRLARRGNSHLGDEWYGYIYKKNHTRFGQPKLLVPSLATGSCFAADLEGRYYFVGSGGGGGGGYGITLDPRAELSPLFVLGVLNSRLSDYFLHKVSTPFRGGYIALNRQYIEQLPIPSAATHQQATVERLVRYVLWLYDQPSVANSDSKRPLDPAVASFYEQVINALVYELFFADELQIAGLHFFGIVNDVSLPTLDSLPSRQSARLQALLDWFQKLQAPGHPLRIALDKLQTLDLVRIIESES
jgi:adenine-specific DNA-methyltransferase